MVLCQGLRFLAAIDAAMPIMGLHGAPLRSRQIIAWGAGFLRASCVLTCNDGRRVFRIPPSPCGVLDVRIGGSPLRNACFGFLRMACTPAFILCDAPLSVLGNKLGVLFSRSASNGLSLAFLGLEAFTIRSIKTATIGFLGFGQSHKRHLLTKVKGEYLAPFPVRGADLRAVISRDQAYKYTIV